jgi:hypothetical protein
MADNGQQADRHNPTAVGGPLSVAELNGARSQGGCGRTSLQSYDLGQADTCMGPDLRREDVWLCGRDLPSLDVIPAKAGIHASIHGRDAGRILARETQ